MSLTLLGQENLSREDLDFYRPYLESLDVFLHEKSKKITLSWENHQFYLHSDRDSEKPIGLDLDADLNRHEHYFKKNSLKNELLAKALGIKNQSRPRVLDLTAGMLSDSLLMLSFGCEVVALERNLVIQLLIFSALRKSTSPKLKNLTFCPYDADYFLLNHPSSFDVIYFDPMFEDFNDKTAPKKQMRVFRSLIGQDSDACQTFERALGCKPRRLVVKRPRYSQELTQGFPSVVKYLGKSIRYDVYFSS